MALRLPAGWPTAAASCNHVPVTMDDLSERVLHSWMAAREREKKEEACSNSMWTAPSVRLASI